MAGKVAVIMGSQSDWPVMQHAVDVLKALKVDYEASVVSAHRTPQRLYDFAATAHEQFSVIIAGAGGAAHLPGMTAAMTWLPVIAVPVTSKALNGVDSLLSIVQMPKGIAVATQAIGEPGAFNAGLMAAQIIATSDADLQERLVAWRSAQTEAVPQEVC
ncbi:MAG: 5-(carboxyamino)imidazole ribonucleotide mutase [Halioglobus sp.]